MLCSANKTTVWRDQSCPKKSEVALCPAAANTASASWNRHVGRTTDRNLVEPESSPELDQCPV